MVTYTHSQNPHSSITSPFLRLSSFRERECILKAQVPGVSMRPPLCTDADDLLRCSARVGNLGERGEPDILTYLVRHWDL